ncbi:hypothetical protein EDI_306140 [Entamoeba dispar SAW760]|uniref:Uncharacterized protein n=1 Tax=Entamoeba dispar (strain ATCC PRA-260 / SAW760) TaxID=370354 RepID=B0EMJ9_ENTDS|nr:uncharacterized protein EDI_306140 [Entamoeba dispar SAW760]EDR24245.1 hypothetical protein EDI_306140 [Entamoeba dispar SAW760]|eukprot:EDR24245.1 hypothetical protein EDI_306140 [Entamoeba dispar SAW760]
MFSPQLIISVLAKLMQDILIDDKIELTYSFCDSLCIIYLFFPNIKENQIQPKIINYHDIIISLFSTCFCSLQFPIGNYSQQKILEYINRFIYYSSFIRKNIYLDGSIINKSYFISFSEDNNSLEWKTEDITITLLFSKQSKPLNWIFINKGWYYEVSKSIFSLFPFFHYHMYFKDNCLLSDFTIHSINTIVFTSKKIDLFENVYDSENLIDTNKNLFLSKESTMLFHYILQKFTINEISSICNTNESREEMKLCELFGDCIEELNEYNPISRDLVENCFITPELLHSQIVQNIAFCGMTTRIDAPSLLERDNTVNKEI